MRYQQSIGKEEGCDLEGGGYVSQQGGGHLVGPRAASPLAHEHLHIINPLHVLRLLHIQPAGAATNPA